VKHWQETDQILRRLAELREAGDGASLATVVDISGSAYRRPGARFLIEEEGATLGGVSGGCLEEDVRRIGLELLDGDECRLLHYDTGSDEDTVWGLGLGCDGEVDVFVQPATTEPFLEAAERIRELLRGQQPFAVSNVVESGGSGVSAGSVEAGASDESGEAGASRRSGEAGEAGAIRASGEAGEAGAFGASDEAGSLPLGWPVVVSGATVVAGSTGDAGLDDEIAARSGSLLEKRESAHWSSGGHRIFTDVLEPPPFLIVCGAGDDALPLVSMATRAGFRVVVVDHRPAYLDEARFPDAWAVDRATPDDRAPGIPATDDTFLVVKTHNLERDRGWTRRFLETPVPYIGLLGPKSRRDDILESVEPAQRDRIYGPVGLDIGADGPEQVALSIVSEVLAVRSGRRPRHLREREVAIHAEA